jgi:hypothetical protein
MVNIIKMDMYRLFKSKSFKVVLIIVIILNLINGSIDRLSTYLTAKSVAEGEEPVVWAKTIAFSGFLKKPVFYFDCIMTLLSIVWFSHSDISHGYIKNIAGQLPKKGHTVISKFIVVGMHNFLLLFVAVIAQTIGYLPYCSIDFGDDLGNGILHFWIKWLLLLAISAIIILFSSGLKSKNAATTIAVVMGGKIMTLTYMLISAGIQKIPLDCLKDFNLSKYMPDSLMTSAEPDVKRAILVSLAIIVVFMTATVKIFNKKDVN